MMYHVKGNLIYVFTDDADQLFLTVHQTDGNPVPVEDQANREYGSKS